MELLQKEIAAHLHLPRKHWQVLEEVDSTNHYAKMLALQGAADGTVVLAKRQTAGRGRLGRSFQSDAPLGIYLSVLWHMDAPPSQLMMLPALAAVAACRAVERVCSCAVEIKWPNDLVLQGRKIGGILTESVWDGGDSATIVGIGINVSHRAEDFATELREMAASLQMLLGEEVSHGALAAALMEELDLLRAEAMDRQTTWLMEYRRRCLTLGKEVQIVTGQMRRVATALEVDDTFGLVVREKDGTQSIVRAGEVSVRGLYGYAP